MSSPFSPGGSTPLEAYLGHASLDQPFPAHLVGRVACAQGWVVQRDGTDLIGLLSTCIEESGGAQVRLLGGRLKALTLSEVSADSLPPGTLLLTPLDGQSGFARSSGLDDGAFDDVFVWQDGAAPWCVDRRSGRVSDKGEGLDALLVEQASDLADRAQLALGYPVEIEWVVQGGRARLVRCVPLPLPDMIPGPSSGSWRRVSLALDDEGTVAPLAIDVLNRALRDPGDKKGAVVQRVFARPYRKRHPEELLRPNGAMKLGDVGGPITDAISKLAPFFTATRDLEADHKRRRDELEQEFDTLCPETLGETITEWVKLAGESVAHLDAARRHNRRLLACIEALVGPIPRTVGADLSMPKFAERRRVVHGELTQLARVLRDKSPSELEGASREHWVAAKQRLASVRVLGIDVLPVAFGETNAALLKAISDRYDERDDAREVRRQAAKHNVSRRLHGVLDLPRSAVLTSVLTALERLTRVKGEIAEALSSTLLGLRAVALEAGVRLEDDAVLDVPEDVFYLSSKEIRKALGGNVAGYAARVRARKEDDRRWAALEAPRRLES